MHENASHSTTAGTFVCCIQSRTQLKQGHPFCPLDWMIVRCNPMIMRFRTITSVHCLPANGRDKNKRPDNFVKSTKKAYCHRWAQCQLVQEVHMMMPLCQTTHSSTWYQNTGSADNISWFRKVGPVYHVCQSHQNYICLQECTSGHNKRQCMNTTCTS
jgi:hypothetical protein